MCMVGMLGALRNPTPWIKYQRWGSYTSVLSNSTWGSISRIKIQKKKKYVEEDEAEERSEGRAWGRTWGTDKAIPHPVQKEKRDKKGGKARDVEVVKRKNRQQDAACNKSEVEMLRRTWKDIDEDRRSLAV